jgi:hypothetical protein
MDPQKTQAIEAISRRIASNVSRAETDAIVMICFVACALVCLLVALWRGAQHDKAARRVRDRLAQEADPEGWARRQPRQALETTLIAEELAAMRRASWYGRLLRWGRQTDQAQG